MKKIQEPVLHMLVLGPQLINSITEEIGGWTT